MYKRGPLNVENQIDNRCVTFIQFTFSFIVVIWVIVVNDYLVQFFLGLYLVLGFYQLEALIRVLMGSLEFFSLDYG
jgi:hypothetical protein